MRGRRGYIMNDHCKNHMITLDILYV